MLIFQIAKYSLGTINTLVLKIITINVIKMSFKKSIRSF